MVNTCRIKNERGGGGGGEGVSRNRQYVADGCVRPLFYQHYKILKSCTSTGAHPLGSVQHSAYQIRRGAWCVSDRDFFPIRSAFGSLLGLKMRHNMRHSYTEQETTHSADTVLPLLGFPRETHHAVSPR